MEGISKVETGSSILVLIGASLVIGSNYVNKTSVLAQDKRKVHTMRVVGGIMLGMAAIGMLITKVQAKKA